MRFGTLGGFCEAALSVACRSLLPLIAIVWVVAAPATATADIKSYAIVNDDATLEVGGHHVHLFGIFIPSTTRTCRSTIRPVRCAPEAALALEFRIQSFVRCEVMSRNRDGSVEARCFVDGAGSVLDPDEDLSAYLLRKGLALAVPSAPFEYHALERIARSQGRGLWSESLRRVP